LSIILLNSSSKCIFNSFPPNFHSSIGKLSNPQTENLSKWNNRNEE